MKYVFNRDDQDRQDEIRMVNVENPAIDGVNEFCLEPRRGDMFVAPGGNPGL
ncbi:MAG: hypothetical protein LCH54_17050 [Bacteroidetes bacterium]|nr:hypothetical protein [Bacteroidota bacterium]